LDSPELAQRLPEWRELIAQVLATNGHRALYRLLRFFYVLGDEAAYTALRGVLHSLSESPQAEELMRSMEQVLLERGMARGKVEGKAEGKAEGVAEGMAKAVLRLLTLRGVRVGTAARKRILGCTDVATLERWFDRAATATRLSDVLDDTAH
jgi:predicted transposase YdaD